MTPLLFFLSHRRLLLLHQQLHNRVLRGDDTTGGDHDIRTAEFLELLDDLRDEGLVTCGKGGNTQYMDIVLHRLFGCLCRGLEERTHIDRQTLRLS